MLNRIDRPRPIQTLARPVQPARVDHPVLSTPPGWFQQDSFTRAGGPRVLGLDGKSPVKSVADRIFDAAKSYEKTPIGNLLMDAKNWHYNKTGSTPIGQYMDYTIAGNNNCANFVGGVLKQTGAVDPEDRMFSVPDVDQQLGSAKYQARGWVKETPTPRADGKPLKLKDYNAFFANAQPPFKKGDVVVLKTGDGKFGHVVFFAGLNEKGEPTFLGSNNVLLEDQNNKGNVLRSHGEIVTDPRGVPVNDPLYKPVKSGDQAVCTLTLAQLQTMIGPASFGVTEVFRAP